MYKPYPTTQLRYQICIKHFFESFVLPYMNSFIFLLEEWFYTSALSAVMYRVILSDEFCKKSCNCNMYMYRNSNSHLLRQYDLIKTNLNVKELFQMVTFLSLYYPSWWYRLHSPINYFFKTFPIIYITSSWLSELELFKLVSLLFNVPQCILKGYPLSFAIY